ncbi:MAG: AraC family transcriptional regulator [Rhizobiaceae bacterium]|nr:AraC family transcriptional regulator [Rhizobiaceae bacterium]
MQYCFMPSGDWTTDATPAPYRPADAMGFHIVASGSCWLEFEGERTALEAGDIAAFPFGTPHVIGSGAPGGRLIDPGNDLPPKPWPEVPVLVYGEEERRVRILCGYVQCEAMNFAPFKDTLPKFLHVSTAAAGEDDWLSATVRQIVAEVDSPRRGGSSVLERLTEVTFIEVLRRQFLRDEVPESGWLAAIHDPALARCLALLHTEPNKDWDVALLAREAGMSRSALTERFTTVLRVPPMRYLRDWRLYLATVELSRPGKSLAEIALEMGYGTEAAFNRAFTRRFGVPPATWRRSGTTQADRGTRPAMPGGGA